MRRTLQALLTIVIFLSVVYPAYSAPQQPKIKAYSAILVDSVTGKVLYEKRCHARRPPASTTKMMTAVLALEFADLGETVCASDYVSKTPYSSLHLKPGEELTLHDLLYGLLLRSANDAAVCVAEHVAGSEEDFVKMMNLKAQQIGARETHFVNPHGLYNKNHYSTAFDLALIARYATRIPEFNDFVRTKKKQIDRTINTKDVTVKNTANFLWKFEGADGIKTGYTKEAGHCFVGSATRNDWRLISVVLRSDKSGEDTASLLNWGFKYFKPVVFTRENQVVQSVDVPAGVTEKLDLIAAKDLALVLGKSERAETRVEVDIEDVRAPVSKGQKLGTLTGYLNGRNVGSVDLVAAESVDRTLGATIWHYTRIVLLVAGAIIVVCIAYGTAFAEIARRRRRRFSPRSREANSLRARSSRR